MNGLIINFEPILMLCDILSVGFEESVDCFEGLPEIAKSGDFEIIGRRRRDRPDIVLG